MYEALQLVPVEVSVNGKAYRREVEPRTLLVEFIRDVLRLQKTLDEAVLQSGAANPQWWHMQNAKARAGETIRRSIDMNQTRNALRSAAQASSTA